MCVGVRLFLLCGSFLSVQAFRMNATPIRACANGEPLPLSVRVAGCSELPCDFLRDRTTHMAIQFVATKDDTSHIRASAALSTSRGGWRPLGHELQEEHRDVCRNLLFGAYCPLYAGEDVTYHLRMSLGAGPTQLPVTVQISLLDRADDDVVACFELDGVFRKHRRR